ncbi:MAG: hypothetical protein UY63_C0019G0006 [Parcubacteria group bacterium GW2011_GWA2_51_10]|nr:MAG: hypothetical protein UY63_C0019G0006 [Parcubacteria group bacterium GW2011_GWA2_51_10]
MQIMQDLLSPPEPKPSIVSNTLGVVGLIILIVILIWGLFHLATLARPWVSSFFSSRAVKNIQIMTPQPNTVSGQSATILWKYSPKEDGAYSFMYQCRSGFQMQTVGVGGTQNTIPCGVALVIPRSSTSLTVTPTLTGTSTLAVPVSVTYMQKATSTSARQTKEAQGSATLSVVTASLAPSTSTTPDARLQTTKPAAAQSSGPADLSVRIISVGVIHPITGDIMPIRATSPNDLVAVTFDIANIGSTSSGVWYFTAQLPSLPPYTFNSVAQVSLAPGDHIENMLRFKPAAQGGTIAISVDPGNAVLESNESNNFVSQNI